MEIRSQCAETKIVAFKNGGTLRNTENWSYNGDDIDIVSEFNYLGVLMGLNGKFLKTRKHVADQGRKALFSILKSQESIDLIYQHFVQFLIICK